MTLLAWQRQPLFGEMDGDEVRLSSAGKVLEYYWNTLPAHFPVEMDQWVILPNHFHGIIFLLEDPVRAKRPEENKSLEGKLIPGCFALTGAEVVRPHGTASRSLGAIIQNFKSNTTREINRFRSTPGQPVWHRNYYERIIRNERELDAIRLYIRDNPRQWAEDSENPSVPR